jgi:dethiobiotin synthetase
MTKLFITGTDTEVGKTIVTACLAAAFRERGQQPRAVKPLATGSPGPGEDATHIARAAGHDPVVFACFPVPASPERAARQAKIELDDDGFMNWMRAQSGDPLLVEGVGGWAVPLTQSITVEDLAIALQAPVIIVAANRLGMLNHTLLTAEAVREAGLGLAGVVVNNAMGEDSPLQQWNIEDLRRWLGPGTPVVSIGSIDDANQASEGERIATAFNL